MNPAGIMLTGWQYIDGIWYYFHWSGPMQTGWQYINSAWYLWMLQEQCRQAGNW